MCQINNECLLSDSLFNILATSADCRFEDQLAVLISSRNSSYNYINECFAF